MAQIAIPLVVAGVLFLISNDKKESFDSSYNANTYNGTHKIMPENDEIVKNSVEHISIETNNEGVYSQYQDKYINRTNKQNNISFHLAHDVVLHDQYMYRLHPAEPIGRDIGRVHFRS